MGFAPCLCRGPKARQAGEILHLKENSTSEQNTSHPLPSPPPLYPLPAEPGPTHHHPGAETPSKTAPEVVKKKPQTISVARNYIPGLGNAGRGRWLRVPADRRMRPLVTFGHRAPSCRHGVSRAAGDGKSSPICQDARSTALDFTRSGVFWGGEQVSGVVPLVFPWLGLIRWVLGLQR